MRSVHVLSNMLDMLVPGENLGMQVNEQLLSDAYGVAGSYAVPDGVSRLPYFEECVFLLGPSLATIAAYDQPGRQMEPHMLLADIVRLASAARSRGGTAPTKPGQRISHRPSWNAVRRTPTNGPDGSCLDVLRPILSKSVPSESLEDRIDFYDVGLALAAVGMRRVLSSADHICWESVDIGLVDSAMTRAGTYFGLDVAEYDPRMFLRHIVAHARAIPPFGLTQQDMSDAMELASSKGIEGRIWPQVADYIPAIVVKYRTPVESRQEGEGLTSYIKRHWDAEVRWPLLLPGVHTHCTNWLCSVVNGQLGIIDQKYFISLVWNKMFACHINRERLLIPPRGTEALVQKYLADMLPALSMLCCATGHLVALYDQAVVFTATSKRSKTGKTGASGEGTEKTIPDGMIRVAEIPFMVAECKSVGYNGSDGSGIGEAREQCRRYVKKYFANWEKIPFIVGIELTDRGWAVVAWTKEYKGVKIKPVHIELSAGRYDKKEHPSDRMLDSLVRAARLTSLWVDMYVKADGNMRGPTLPQDKKLTLSDDKTYISKKVRLSHIISSWAEWPKGNEIESQRAHFRRLYGEPGILKPGRPRGPGGEHVACCCLDGNIYRARISIKVAPVGCVTLPENIDQLRKYMTAVVWGIDFLHKVGISHEDIRPANIILCEDGNWRIIDFEHSTPLEISDPTRDYSAAASLLDCVPWAYLHPAVVDLARVLRCTAAVREDWPFISKIGQNWPDWPPPLQRPGGVPLVGFG